MDRSLIHWFVVGFSTWGILSYASLFDRKRANLYLAAVGLLSSVYVLIYFGWGRLLLYVGSYLVIASVLHWFFKTRLHK